jgi:hypothetical protein
MAGGYLEITRAAMIHLFENASSQLFLPMNDIFVPFYVIVIYSVT